MILSTSPCKAGASPRGRTPRLTIALGRQIALFLHLRSARAIVLSQVIALALVEPTFPSHQAIIHRAASGSLLALGAAARALSLLLHSVGCHFFHPSIYLMSGD